MTDNSAQNPEQLMLAFVHGRICSIQNDYLSASGKPRGARKLATLRHALLMPMGSNADAWPLEFEGLPAELVGRGAEPSWAETAVHAALTLYMRSINRAKPSQCMCLAMSIRLVQPCDSSCGAIRDVIRISKRAKCLEGLGPL